MLELGAPGRPHRGCTLRRALARVLCLALLLAGGIHASHAIDAYAVSLASGIAPAGETDHHGAAGHAHGLGASCSLAHGCAMSAALPVTTGPLLTPAGLVDIGRDRWHRGLDTAPHPHPPRLSAAV
jgi:hypothetical protein